MYLEVLENRTLFAGVTILTHGNEGNITGWIASAAAAMQVRFGGTDAASIYIMKVGSDGVESVTLADGNKPLEQTTKSEAIVELDWSSIADTSHFTDGVASNVADYLLNTHSGVPDFKQLPIHLIGHSRGASLMVALSYDLGQRGIWVDQVTNLDPHPIGQISIPFIGTFGDAKMRTYSNVIFADTYYRNGGIDLIDPHGQSVGGSFNQNLNDTVQKTHELSAHMSVTAYYHGTIDFNAKQNGDALVHSSWYGTTPDKPPRDATGFYFTQEVGGPRALSGLSTTFGGKAARSTVKLKGTQWANIISPRMLGKSHVGQHQKVTFKALYGDSDSSDTVTFFFDRNQNPYDGTSHLFSDMSVPTSDAPHSAKLTARITSHLSGKYFLGAQITDAQGHVRYIYSSRVITVRAPAVTASVAELVAPATTKSLFSIDVSPTAPLELL
jgi:hypothetical protein